MKQILFIILIFGGCKGSNVEPSPPTDNERFYCEIDGERYRPNSNGDIFNEVLIADWYKLKGTFTVSAYNSKTYKDVLFFINLKGQKLEVKKHYIDSLYAKASYSGGYIKVNGNSIREDYSSIKGIGFIEITKLDTLTKKVSGKFEFDAQSKIDKTKIAKIRNGQFNNLTY